MRYDIFQAIADPNRRKIIGLLAERDMTVSEITEHFDMSRPGVSKHLKILKRNAVISVQEIGRERLHKLHPETLKGVAEWVNYYSRYWDEKLLSLKNAVEQENDL